MGVSGDPNLALIGARFAGGGEGEIHAVLGRPDLAAKLYKATPSVERIRKLESMVTIRPASKHLAWPIELVRGPQGVVGFIMSRIREREELHNLLTPVARRRVFPNADYRFLVATGANLARAIAVVHEAGGIIGDINERLALVGTDATVALIDCDSFQVTLGPDVFSCDVGTPQYQPPELQGLSFRGLRRTRNHDAFGLAVLLFELLFFGRHPFAGRDSNGDPLEPAEAISQLRFAWETADQQPPNTLSLTTVGEALGQFFRRAFGKAGIDTGRPKAAAWATRLDDFAAALKQCSAEPAHWHLPGACPLCQLQAKVRVLLFAPSGVAQDLPDFAAVAKSLQSKLDGSPRLRCMAAPDPATTFPGLTAQPLPTRRPDRLSRWLGAVGMSENGSAWRNELASRTAALSAAETLYRKASERWIEDGVVREEAVCRNEIIDVVRRFGQLATDARSAIDALKLDSKRTQLNAFLDSFEIATSDIGYLGTARRLALQAAGIETAADVEEVAVRAVPGFGDVLTQRLMDWRFAAEQRFVFDPSRGIDPGAYAKCVADFRSRSAALNATAAAAMKRLGELIAQHHARRETSWKALYRLARAVAQARIDLAIMR